MKHNKMLYCWWCNEEIEISWNDGEKEPTKKELICPKCLNNKHFSEKKKTDDRDKNTWLISFDTHFCKWEYSVPIEDKYSIEDVAIILLNALGIDKSVLKTGVLMCSNETKNKYDYAVDKWQIIKQASLNKN